MSKEQDFKFYLPLDLIKSEDDEAADSWQIQGIASTPDEDLQGETVDQNGLDISMLKAGRGIFNFDHKKDPQYVLGQIEDADFIDKGGKKALLVKGYLFKHQDAAKGVYNIMKSLKKGVGHRVHMSIEGKVIQRDFINNKAIKKARIDKVALTLDPVNPYTYTELVKSLNSPEAIEEAQKIENSEEMITIAKSDLQKLVEFAQKAMSAGTGYAGAPGAMRGGAALTTEDLESKPKDVTYGEKKKKRKKDMLKSLMKSLKEAYPSEDPMQLAEWVIESVFDKLDEK
jgi:hypothetical protein